MHPTRKIHIIVFTTLSVIAVQYLIRPHWQDAPLLFRYLLFCYPNLAAGILMTLLFPLLPNRFSYLLTVQVFKLYCMISILVLLGYEYAQLLPIWNKTFDYLDIAASIAGVSSGYTYVTILLRNKIHLASTLL